MFADMVDKEVRKFIKDNLITLELDPPSLDKAVTDSMDLVYGAIGSSYMVTNPSAWKAQALFTIERSIMDTVNNTTTSVVSGLADYYRQLLITQKEKIMMNQANNQPTNSNTSSEMPHITITPTAGVEDATIKSETTRSAVDTAVESVMAKAADTGAPVGEAAVRSAFTKVGALAEEAAAAGYSAEEIEKMVVMMTEAAEANQAKDQPQPEVKVEPQPQPTPEPAPQPQPQQAKAAAPKMEEGYSTLQKTAMWVGGAIAVGVVGYGIYRLVKSGDAEVATKAAAAAANVSTAAAAALSDFA